MSLKVCTIGCGSHASWAHGPSFMKYTAAHPDTVLAACCDISEERAKAYQSSYGFKRFYLDIDEMLDTEKPDAVCLIAPEYLTGELAAKVLVKKYPLLLEKPPGKDSHETRKLIELAEKYNVPNAVAFNRRYHPVVKKLKSLLSESFKPEEIHNIRYEMYRYNRKESLFWTTAIHGIDVVRFLAGSDYRHIRFHYQEFPELGQGIANIYMDCTFESGSTAQLSFNPICGVNSEQAVINTLNNTFMTDISYNSPGKLVHMEAKQIKLDITGTEISDATCTFDFCGYYQENEDFFEDIRAGRKPQGDLKSSLQSMIVTECIANREAEYFKK